jgi:phosphohistidine swiveling domain-containing protein/DNA-binding transcriptional ArsR family regulator
MKNLFKSETSYELLRYFVGNENGEFYLSELASRIGKDPANTTRELTRLQREGMVSVRTEGKRKFYRLNGNHPQVEALRKMFSASPSDLEATFKTTWMLAEDIPNMDPFFSQIWLHCFVTDFGKHIGRAYKKIAAIHRDYHLWFYFDEKDAHELAEHIVDLFEHKSSFMRQVNKNIVLHSNRLRSCAEGLPQEGLPKLSDKELFSYYLAHEKTHRDYYTWAWIPVASDMFSNSLTLRGKKILRAKGVPEEKLNEYLTLLTEPRRPSLIKEEQDSLMRIGIAIEKDKKQLTLIKELGRLVEEEEVGKFGLATHGMAFEKKFAESLERLLGKLSPAIQKGVERHFLTYFYTRFLFTEEQGVYTLDHYYRSLIRLVNGDAHLAETAKKTDADIRKKRAEQIALIRKLRLSKSEQTFFAEWGEFMVTKIYRRFAQVYAIYRMIPVIEEIGRRIGLSLKETKFMTTDELEAALFGKHIEREKVRARVPFSVSYADRDRSEWLAGAAAEKLLPYLQKETQSDVAELTGQCGCRGMATGIVKTVNVPSDMKKMNDGDILVAICTQPDLLPAMKKAVAFVTDQGGVTSHAAIVARELNTPCVIGTKIATKVLKDGDLVEVDANKGIVKILKRA